jgi:hypothetical protein
MAELVLMLSNGGRGSSRLGNDQPRKQWDFGYEQYSFHSEEDMGVMASTIPAFHFGTGVRELGCLYPKGDKNSPMC